MFFVDVLDAAGAEAETDGVAEVTKQLEKEVIEDKEKDDDGEEGECVTPVLSLQWGWRCLYLI